MQALVPIALGCLCLTITAQDTRPAKPAVEATAPLIALVEDEVRAGRVVGAQLAGGDSRGIARERSVGRVRPERDRPVCPETLFCIGSCSKPSAAACIVSLAADGTLTLDEPIVRWLPPFRDLAIEGGGRADR